MVNEQEEVQPSMPVRSSETRYFRLLYHWRSPWLYHLRSPWLKNETQGSREALRKPRRASRSGDPPLIPV